MLRADKNRNGSTAEVGKKTKLLHIMFLPALHWLLYSGSIVLEQNRHLLRCAYRIVNLINPLWH